MTDTLLFLHLLSAAMVFVGVAVTSAQVLGGRIELSTAKITNAIWGIGLIGTIVFGIWLAFDIESYDPWDVWVLIAIVLWLAAGGTGDKVRVASEKAAADGTALARDAATAHWIRVVVVVLLLADMVWKPWV